MRKIIVIAIIFATVACGPHFNMHAKPDIYAAEPAQTVKEQAPAPATTEPDTTKRTITIPAWPTFAYMADGIEGFLLLVVKEPTKEVPIPKEFTFKSDDGKVVVMKLMQPKPAEKGK